MILVKKEEIRIIRKVPKEHFQLKDNVQMENKQLHMQSEGEWMHDIKSNVSRWKRKRREKIAIAF